jgi:DNA polymerase-3 subunit gamma/tau
MRFDFKLVPTEKIVELISKIYDELNKKYTKEAVFAIAKAGEGSIRDALSIADTALSYSQGELTYNDVMEILGSIGTERLYSFIKSILESKTGEVLNHINELSKLGKSVGVLTKDVTATLRDLLVIKTCSDPNAILAFPQNKFHAILDK